MELVQVLDLLFELVFLRHKFKGLNLVLVLEGFIVLFLLLDKVDIFLGFFLDRIVNILGIDFFFWLFSGLKDLNKLWRELFVFNFCDFG